MKKPVFSFSIVAVFLIVIFMISSGFYSQTAEVTSESIVAGELIIETPSVEAIEKNADTEVQSENKPMPIYGDWRVFTMADGLPSNKVNAVKIDADRILVGTDRGLAVLENGEWSVYTPEDGLAHRNVISIDVNEDNGDVWIGTMNGLNRWSAGVFERFDQFNSGLANNVVYDVSAGPRYTWIATTAGANRYDTYTNQWKIFNEETSPMHEPWCYGITSAGNKAWIAAWGGGVLEYNNDTDEFRVYRDPDGHFQISLFPDDGLVHDITTGVAFDNGTLWVSTYFGAGRYNGQRWWGYHDHVSGLTSNFINAVNAKNSIAYFATDNGLNTFDGTTWVTYNTNHDTGKGITTITHGDTERQMVTDTSISHGFIWNMDARDDVIWVATSMGLSTARIVGYVDETIL
ncbi:MAG: regulator [Balneolaceae bacterium]|nr:MAG: regulator [Balneolaceae bacterium]